MSPELIRRSVARRGDGELELLVLADVEEDRAEDGRDRDGPGTGDGVDERAELAGRLEPRRAAAMALVMRMPPASTGGWCA